MTGTLAPNGILDIFGQMLLIDDGEALGKKIGEFRDRHCKPHPIRVAGGREIQQFDAKPGAFDEVRRLIAPRVTALDADDFVQLPERIDSDVPVQLPDSVMKMYKAAKKDAFVELSDGRAFMANGGAAAKLKQICNGLVYLRDPITNQLIETVKLHDAKAEALEELLDELNRPALVAYEFSSDGEYLAKRLNAPMVRGGMKLPETMKLIERWNRKELPVLLVQPQAMAESLNLQTGGDVVVWYSPPWDLGQWIQCNARLARQGQASQFVHIYHLVAKGTVDERIWSVLQQKDATQEALMLALKTELES